MVTNVMSVLSLEDDVPCALAALSKDYSITLLGQQLQDGATHPIPLFPLL